MSYIVYVEDDPHSCEIMRVLLRHFLGTDDFAIFSDSHDLLAKLAALPVVPDLFLLDIYMEPLDGYTLLGLLRQDPRYQHKPVVALTASVTAQEVERIRAAGFDGMIGKPVSSQTLPAIIRRLLQGEQVWKGA